MDENDQEEKQDEKDDDDDGLLTTGNKAYSVPMLAETYAFFTITITKPYSFSSFIVIFDSLRSTNRVAIMNNIFKYLIKEAETRKNVVIAPDNRPPRLTAKVRLCTKNNLNIH